MALGPGVAAPAEGTRVALAWLATACVSCRYCVSDWETLCPAQKNTGYSIDGGPGSSTESRRLEQANEAFDEVLAGDVPARLIFRF